MHIPFRWSLLMVVIAMGCASLEIDLGTSGHVRKISESIFLLTATPTSANFTYSTSSSVNFTTSPPPGKSSSWQGYVGASIAILFFGSSFVPLKKFETGDGMFFQWILCSAIWIAGLITNCATDFHKFYPLCMLGGFLWATGNICVVPIVKTIGLGLGMLIWGTSNLLAGWASSRFGWFGLEKQTPNNPTLNYISIGFAAMSAVFWLFVKSDGQPESDGQPVLENADEDEELLITNEEPVPLCEEAGDSWVDNISPLTKRLVGSMLSILSGIFYGLSFVPVIYVKNNYTGASQADIDYVFAHFSGIFATSSLYFIVYCVYMKNKPKLYPQAILPGVISGAMWAVAEIGWFIANRFLTPAVSFPIVTTGPGIIASLWGVFVFHEVKGIQNFIVMGVAYAFTIVGAVLSGLSKVEN